MLIKPFGARCNLRCRYCFYPPKLGLHALLWRTGLAAKASGIDQLSIGIALVRG
jgi:molybdenum cofactor biosynthesis enzyme MoaA